MGADVRHTQGESRELFSYVASEPTRQRKAGGESLTSGLFGEVSLEAGRLTLSGGGRIDHYSIDKGFLLERQIATGATLRDEHYAPRNGWRPTARVGAVVDVGEGFSLRSAAYLGWRLPTLNELFRPFRAGPDATAANPLLDPEKLTGIEGGLRYDKGGISLSASAFANRLTDAIANVTLGRGPGIFPGVGFVGAGGEYRQRLNIASIRVRGLEFSGSVTRGPWSARAGYAFADAKVRGGSFAAQLDGLRPAQTPRHSFSAGLSWDDSGRAMSIILRHSGRQYEDDLNQRSLPSATTLDGSAAWPLTGALDLVVRGENLLDAQVVAGIDGNGAIERATPRTFWLGLRFGR
ncbi:MAG: TonB-dependent receptor [Sphingomicrobium sp.]